MRISERSEGSWREERETEWRNLRPVNYMMGPIDPRSVYPSYPRGPFYGDRDYEDQ